MVIYKINPIGIIRTPYKEIGQVPRQTIYSKGAEGIIEIYNKYLEGLEGIKLYIHIIVLFYFDRLKRCDIKVRPPGSNKLRGVFATRSPYRPNHIGLSILRLEKVEGNILRVRDVDMLDRTPIIDIKPYVEKIDKK